MDNKMLLEIAYKKLKSHVYFDKTLVHLRDELVQFESKFMCKNNTTDNNGLAKIEQSLSDHDLWTKYEEDILDKIGILTYPKKIKSISEDTAIFNADNIPIELEEPQYFIDLPVEGHILSVLWILTYGIELDKSCDENNPNGMYEHSYGNRLRKTLVNKESNSVTYSPILFEPYFSQYESWRDYGLERAKERLNNSQDAVILTLDFRRFFYSVDINEGIFDRFESDCNSFENWKKWINRFIFKVIVKYSEKLREINKDKELVGDRNILPIGFLPSNILSNFALTPFDNAIINKWNPVYYGRYVDDIIIVDKVEKNSPLYKQARNKDTESRADSVYVINLFLKDILEEYTENTSDKGKAYKISSSLLGNSNSKVCVNSQKVKMFYFYSGATTALLDTFKTKIAQNASEFRLFPKMDSALSYRNYMEIFNLNSDEGINKFRGVTGIELDKYSLSKFLGKYRKVSGMIDSKEETDFEKDLMLILDKRILLSNYLAWERILEILVVNNKFLIYENLIHRILEAIEDYKAPESIRESAKNTLYYHLYASVCRTSAIVKNNTIDKILGDFCVKLSEKAAGKFLFDKETTDDLRKWYCKTRMVNKYIMPFPIDCVLINMVDEEYNLSSFTDSLSMLYENWDIDITYHFYPYLVTPQEISYAITCSDLKKNKTDLDPILHQEIINKIFIKANYPSKDEVDCKTSSLSKVKCVTPSEIFSDRNLSCTIISCEESEVKEKLKIALGSVNLYKNDFSNLLDSNPNRSYKRYKHFVDVFNATITEKADMLLLPENYLPFEWIPEVTRICARNKIALVSGIEHIVFKPNDGTSKGTVYNLTVTILPYECDGYPFASVTYHNKVVYAPFEKQEITDMRYSFKEGNSYQLFSWKNVWFPVYCCFELASITDRAIFKEYADMIIAVEWNKDINYYSNIVESLSRDLHCYCIQVNSSDYGDSRIVAPTSNEKKDIVKIKGGKNSFIAVDTIDIKGLRDFQMLEFPSQKKLKTFKPTPPGFTPDNIIDKKRKHQLTFNEN